MGCTDFLLAYAQRPRAQWDTIPILDATVYPSSVFCCALATLPGQQSAAARDAQSTRPSRAAEHCQHLQYLPAVLKHLKPHP